MNMIRHNHNGDQCIIFSVTEDDMVTDNDLLIMGKFGIFSAEGDKI